MAVSARRRVLAGRRFTSWRNEIQESGGAIPQSGGAIQELHGAFPQSCGAIPESRDVIQESCGAIPQSGGAIQESCGAIQESGGAMQEWRDGLPTRRGEPMLGPVKQQLQQQLEEIRREGLYKSERVITTPQGA